jgi:alkylation response protein AidB-like acyl-CoA dehydrogenase
MLGDLNQGWQVAITALMNERANLGAGLYAMFQRGFHALVQRVGQLRRGGAPLIKDPLVRQKLARMHVELEIFRLNNNRALTRLNKTGMPGPEASIQKLYWSEFNQRMSQATLEILGPHAQRWDYDEGRWAYNYLRARGNTIEAGTSEVQRNIVAQRVLELPKSY